MVMQKLHHPGRYVFDVRRYGTMGYAIPAAFGAKLGQPDRQVVAVCGDGSFQMSMMELASMRQHGVPAKIVVISNQYLGMVREYQQNTYKGRYSVVELSGSPDLGKLSEAYGMDYIRLDDPADMDDAITGFLEDDKAVLLECVVDPMDTVK
ncbi:MAG: thiamine pyrophosphate-dependent enzyme [Eisenbergiella sp.]